MSDTVGSSSRHPPLEFSSDESETFASAESESMNSYVVDKLVDYVEYLYDDEDDFNVLRRVFHTGICTAFPKTIGGECGPVITQEEMEVLDNSGNTTSSFANNNRIEVIEEDSNSLLGVSYSTTSSKRKDRYKSRSKKKRSMKDGDTVTSDALSSRASTRASHRTKAIERQNKIDEVKHYDDKIEVSAEVGKMDIFQPIIESPTPHKSPKKGRSLFKVSRLVKKSKSKAGSTPKKSSKRN